MRANRSVQVISVVVAIVLLGGWLDAHDEGHSVLTLDTGGSSGAVSGVLKIPIIDIEPIVNLDANGDFMVSQPELEHKSELVRAVVIDSLEIERSSAPCKLLVEDMRSIQLESGPHVSVRFSAQCLASGKLGVSTTLFFGHSAYSVLLSARTAHGAFDSVLTPANRIWLEPDAPSWWSTLQRFVSNGMHHVLIGYDHIAFVLLLLLPSVLRPTREGWVRVGNVRQSMSYLARIVTLFTIAHSITLALATTGLVRLPARPIEVTIAVSIVAAGIVNLTTYSARMGAPLAFGFGLVHGFGFANVLVETGNQGLRLVPMLAGFNIGVEVAQLAIVFTALPVLVATCRLPAYSRILIPGLSIVLALCGAVWVVSRW
jgi:hypothetical protein